MRVRGEGEREGEREREREREGEGEGEALGGPTRQSQPHEPSGDAVPSAGLVDLAAFDGRCETTRKLAARRARHRPVRCSQWVSGWLGSPWGRALGGPTHHFKPHEPSGDAVPSAGLASCRLRRPMRDQKEACGAPKASALAP